VWRVGLEVSQNLGMLLTPKKKLLQLQPTKVVQGVAGRLEISQNRACCLRHRKNFYNCNLPWSEVWWVGLEVSQKLGMLLTLKKKLLQLQPTKVVQGAAGRAEGFTELGL
jgi:hypothetical protein